MYIKLIAKGWPKTKAFREAYPEHMAVQRHLDGVKRGKPRDEIFHDATLVTAAAKDKLQAKYIQSALITYQARMEQLANKSLDVAEDLLDNGKSEKVKADLAIEFIRHQVGTPVQKVAAHVEKQVTITFGRPLADARPTIDQ